MVLGIEPSVLRVSSASGEPGEAVALEFRADLAVPVRLFQVRFELPAGSAELLRVDGRETAAAHVRPAGVVILTPDATTEIFTVTLNVQHGVLNIRTDVVGGLAAGNVTGNGTATLVLTGTQTQINLTLAATNNNAAANGLVAQFEVADLFKPNLEHYGRFDKYLIDPPREGAASLVHALPEGWPRRIVYVSCDSATFARDAEVLVHKKGYTLAAAGVVNMFPHTAHVESIALFEKEGGGRP
jgi:hypothetical protein